MVFSSVPSKRRSESRKLELPNRFGRVSRRLKSKFDQPQPIQTGDLAHAYHTGLQLALAYSQQLQVFTTLQNNDDLICSCRPGNGVKNPTRILEKALGNPVPLDFLGGKIVAGSLARVYEIAERIPDHFTVRYFSDRFLNPQQSGYRDLQFQIELKGQHIAELKVVHLKINELDEIEHYMYEIIRRLNAKLIHDTLTQAEIKVRENLIASSLKLYNETWQDILESER